MFHDSHLWDALYFMELRDKVFLSVSFQFQLFKKTRKGRVKNTLKIVPLLFNFVYNIILFAPHFSLFPFEKMKYRSSVTKKYTEATSG